MTNSNISLAEIPTVEAFMPTTPEVVMGPTPTIEALQELATVSALQSLRANQQFLPSLEDKGGGSGGSDLPKRDPSKDGGKIEKIIEKDKGGGSGSDGDKK